MVTYTSVGAESSPARRNTLPAGGEETGIQAECVAPQPTTPDLETQVRELIAAYYRPITDEEYAELKKICPDETLLISRLQWAKLKSVKLGACLKLRYFPRALVYSTDFHGFQGPSGGDLSGTDVCTSGRS